MIAVGQRYVRKFDAKDKKTKIRGIWSEKRLCPRHNSCVFKDRVIDLEG